jgi:hypothetical protein
LHSMRGREPQQAAAAGAVVESPRLPLRETSPAAVKISVAHGNDLYADIQDQPTMPTNEPTHQSVTLSPPAAPPRFHWLVGKSGVQGYAHRLPDGTTSASTLKDDGLAARMQFVWQLANGVGQELGLEQLREVHVLAKDARYASVMLDDASIVDVQATSLLNTHETIKLVRNG